MTRTIESALVTTAVLVLALTGCAGELEVTPSTPVAVCRNYYDALIAYNERCEVFPDRIGPARARVEEECVGKVEAPGVKSWAAQLDRCASELSAASCGDWIACFWEGAARGELSAGAPCSEGIQCESGHCRRTLDAACGVCSSLSERSPVGGSCDSVGCVDGSVCVVSSGGGKCTAIKFAQSGQPCGDSPDTITGCAKGLRCVRSGGGQLGTCRAPSGVGGDCRSRSDCAEDLTCDADRCTVRLPEGATCEQGDRFVCAKGLACDAGTCRKTRRVKTGETCDQMTRLCERGDCRGASQSPHGEDDPSTARCVDQLPEGAACEWANACERPARCIAGKCTTIDPAVCR